MTKMKLDRGQWKTIQGEVKEIAWMDSIHVAHSANLIIRRVTDTGLPRGRHWTQPIVEEAKLRGIWFNKETERFDIPHKRETVAELCALNACAVHGISSPIDRTAEELKAKWPKAFQTFLKLRLTR